MQEINIIFPHQLFEKSALIENGAQVYLVEEHLFFTQYGFHKQKIGFHRASMKFYESYLRSNGIDVTYIESADSLSDIRMLVASFGKNRTKKINYIDPTDNWLERRLIAGAAEADINLSKHESPLFINSREEIEDFFRHGKKKLFQTKFYIEQRKKRGILLEPTGKAVGGKWSFDKENRKKYPKGKSPPGISYPASGEFFEEARSYVVENFANNPGSIGKLQLYPVDFDSAREWLGDFFRERFAEFGDYEDAIVSQANILNHSLLSPMLNTGLITPHEVIEKALQHFEDFETPLNSVEGFIRQIVGWREFLRGVYEFRGSSQRTRNFFGFDRKIPDCFYDGTTGIEPVDNTIQKVLRTGYCHHIERLMILGNFMLLCEFDPDEVYRWFMELFIDSYDWVMVPNVYGMSQFADGGMMSTKPYISSSNYIMKMSDYGRGDWQSVWDGLFWRFMDEQRDFFQNNPRSGMLLGVLDRMSNQKRLKLFGAAEEFISQLEKPHA